MVERPETEPPPGPEGEIVSAEHRASVGEGWDPGRLAVQRASASAASARGSEDIAPAVEFSSSDPTLSKPAAIAAPAMSGGGQRRLAVNAAAGGASNALKICIQLVMLPVMAHLLGPTEFGIYALALPTVSFFMTLADGGLGISLAREDERSTLVWSTAFWTLLMVGIALALLVTAWGTVLSYLSHVPRLVGIMSFLSLSFVLITVAVLPTARLTRRGRLVVLSGTDLGSTLVGAFVAVALASHGAGAWSLAAQYVVGLAVRAAALNAAAFALPTAEFRLSALRQHVSAGSAILGSRLVDFGGRLAENLFYGRTFGSAALGNYTFANQAPRFICEAASGPLWGALYAHALGEDRQKVAALYEKLVYLLATVVFPIALLLAASAPEVLDLVLGSKWSEASALLQILVPGYAINAVASQSGAILMANNRSRELFWSYAGLTAARIAAVGTGFTTGPIAVAWGVTAANVLFSLYMFGAPARTNGGSIAPVLRGLVAPIVSSAVAALACYYLLAMHARGLGWTVLSLGCGALVYLPILLLADGGRLYRELAAVKRIVSPRGEQSANA